jgi:hypothetical protein
MKEERAKFQREFSILLNKANIMLTRNSLRDKNGRISQNNQNLIEMECQFAESSDDHDVSSCHWHRQYPIVESQVSIFPEVVLSSSELEVFENQEKIFLSTLKVRDPPCKVLQILSENFPNLFYQDISEEIKQKLYVLNPS